MLVFFGAVSKLSQALAIAAGAAIGLMPFLIVYDVMMRNLGWFEPPIWAVPASEFALLYAMALASPWLVQRRGHVIIEALFQRLTLPAQRRLETIIYIVSITFCLLLAFLSSRRAVTSFIDGETDYRSFAMPAELLFAPLALSFLLMAIEFLRFLVGPESYYRGDTSDRGSV
jgi:TRAP-type C4-dicarboxylate transport system permease small subunit